VAVAAAVQAAFGFNGQKCSAMSRLILVDEIHDALLERVRGREPSARHRPRRR
jgi:1-pyrroline-5-carboxylate dehydrogenase